MSDSFSFCLDVCPTFVQIYIPPPVAAAFFLFGKRRRMKEGIRSGMDSDIVRRDVETHHKT